jgi:hypothetical protein
MSLQQKSQTSIFFLFGTIIFVAVLIITFLSTDTDRKKLSISTSLAMRSSFDVLPIDSYVQACLSKVSRNSLLEVSPITTADLESYVKESIGLCLDFSKFEDQGFDISTGGVEINTIINADGVAFMMIHPIKIQHPSGAISRISNFNAQHTIA